MKRDHPNEGVTINATILKLNATKMVNMPTVIKIGPYRFFFYSNEGNEAPHIHIQKENNLAKFWLNPVTLASSSRFKSHELNEIERYVLENQEQFLEAWNEYFGI